MPPLNSFPTQPGLFLFDISWGLNRPWTGATLSNSALLAKGMRSANFFNSCEGYLTATIKNFLKVNHSDMPIAF